MILRATVAVALLEQPAKIRNWATYWDDPAHVRQAIVVGVCAVAFVAFLVVYDRVTSKKKRKR